MELKEFAIIIKERLAKDGIMLPEKDCREIAALVSELGSRLRPEIENRLRRSVAPPKGGAGLFAEEAAELAGAGRVL